MNPNIAAVINAGVAVVGVLAAMTPSMFPSYVPAGVAADVTQTAGFVMALWGGVNSYLHVTSPSTPGALGK
jgi:hypothetical protein